MHRLTLSLVVAVLLLVTACGSDESAGTSNPSPTSTSTATSGATPVAETPVAVSAPAPTDVTTAPSTDATPSKYAGVSSMVVLGHSGATGYYSDEAAGKVDTLENSWATGTNPDVDSIYTRILAENPAIKGNNNNLATDGSRVSDLVRQATAAVALVPLPDLFLIQTVDNDIKCDGTDAGNYDLYETTLSSALQIIATAAPTATIFIVSSPWATAEHYAEVTKGIPAVVHSASGDEPCDTFDSSGALRTEGITYLQDVIDHYLARVADACSQIAQCVYDDGAIANLDITVDDLGPDFNHLSIAGHAKMAATVWSAMQG